MTDDTIRHYYPGTDPLDLTFHQTFTMLENIGAIEGGKTGEVNHRAAVERQAKQMRLANG